MVTVLKVMVGGVSVRVDGVLRLLLGVFRDSFLESVSGANGVKTLGAAGAKVRVRLGCGIRRWVTLLTDL